MKKFLCAVLGLLWVMPVWCVCYDYTSATGTVVQDGTPTPMNPIYPTFYTKGDMVLRKVGDVADTYDATTGKITRRVGVRVLDGNTSISQVNSSFRVAAVADLEPDNKVLCSHYDGDVAPSISAANQPNFTCKGHKSSLNIYIKDESFTTVDDFQAYLADQYNAGTPVTVYYKLAAETTEDWPSPQCGIKIATTKYTETQFSPIDSALANARSIVDTVVSNTITQAASIATLHANKQTRPADDSECPAGKKCLLVTDENDVPHWYEIIEDDAE